MNITDRDVKSELPLGTVVIKLYAVPVGTKCNRNIVCENERGDIVWRVADVLPGQDSPFMNIRAYDGEKIIAYNWIGMDYYINIRTGEASIANPEQRPWWRTGHEIWRNPSLLSPMLSGRKQIDMSVLEYESADMISNFTLIEKIENYDKANNPLNLSVYEWLPIGVKWNYNGQAHEIQNGNRLTVKLLNDRKHIAIIEVSDNRNLNEAYIVDGTSVQKYNLRKLLNETNLEIRSPHIIGDNHRIKLNKDTLIFYDVYYINQELYFYAVVENEDYRFSFDLETGKIGKLTISK